MMDARSDSHWYIAVIGPVFRDHGRTAMWFRIRDFSVSGRLRGRWLNDFVGQASGGTATNWKVETEINRLIREVRHSARLRPTTELSGSASRSAIDFRFAGEHGLADSTRPYSAGR